MAADVTSSRLMNTDKEPQNWLMVNKDYASHRYSELDQINKDNVKNLHVAFTVALGGTFGVARLPWAAISPRRLLTTARCTSSTAYGAVYKIDVRDPAKARIAWLMDPGVDKADVLISLKPRCYAVQEFRHFGNRQR